MSPRFMPISQAKNAAPDRTDAEGGDREPLRCRVGPHRGFDQPMHQGGEQRRRRAKARDRIGRHRLELARHHRIGRPHEGRDERREQAGQLAHFKAGAAAGEQQHRAGQSEQGADDVVRQQPLAGQQRREQHDQQRPEIIQQARLGGRREAQREEIQRVIAEQAADPDDPCSQRLLQGGERRGAKQEAGEARPRRRSRTSSPPAETPGFFRSRPSAPTAATTSGSRSVRSGWRCGRSWSCMRVIASRWLSELGTGRSSTRGISSMSKSWMLGR